MQRPDGPLSFISSRVSTSTVLGFSLNLIHLCCWCKINIELLSYKSRSFLLSESLTTHNRPTEFPAALQSLCRRYVNHHHESLAMSSTGCITFFSSKLIALLRYYLHAPKPRYVIQVYHSHTVKFTNFTIPSVQFNDFYYIYRVMQLRSQSNFLNC